MAKHNISDILTGGAFPSSGAAFYSPALSGHLLAWGTSVPSAAAGYAPGCIFLHTDGSGAADMQYINVGSATSCTFQATSQVGSSGLQIAALAGSPFSWGSAVPGDGLSGYEDGAVFLHDDGASAADRIYANSGTDSSCAFKPLAFFNSVGFIPLSLASVRELSTGSLLAAAANGGLLATDTTPILNAVNGVTDGCWRIQWAGTVVDPIGFQIALPPDLDEAANVLLKFRAAMSNTNDTPVIDVLSFFNEGDTAVADASAAVTGTTYAEYTVTIDAADVPAGAQTLTCQLTPAAHGTDALYLTALWLEYTKLPLYT